MQTGKSGRQVAAENLQRFKGWVIERDRVGDWADYWRGDKLNRTNIAQQCGFGKSALQQNPTIKAELEVLEKRLRFELKFNTRRPENQTKRGTKRVLDVKGKEALARRNAAADFSAESRVKSLEAENAVLRAELARLREAQKLFSAIEHHLVETGRMVHP